MHRPSCPGTDQSTDGVLSIGAPTGRADRDLIGAWRSEELVSDVSADRTLEAIDWAIKREAEAAREYLRLAEEVRFRRDVQAAIQRAIIDGGNYYLHDQDTPMFGEMQTELEAATQRLSEMQADGGRARVAGIRYLRNLRDFVTESQQPKSV